jgi:hypothetical protein
MTDDHAVSAVASMSLASMSFKGDRNEAGKSRCALSKIGCDGVGQ